MYTPRLLTPDFYLTGDPHGPVSLPKGGFFLYAPMAFILLYFAIFLLARTSFLSPSLPGIETQIETSIFFLITFQSLLFKGP